MYLSWLQNARYYSDDLEADASITVNAQSEVPKWPEDRPPAWRISEILVCNLLCREKSKSIIGWIQIKIFNEIASSYVLAAHEIGIIKTSINQVSTETNFSEFVNEAERAFSREHTQWTARRNS